MGLVSLVRSGFLNPIKSTAQRDAQETVPVSESVNLNGRERIRIMGDEFVVSRNFRVCDSEVILEIRNVSYFKAVAIRAKPFVCMLCYKVCSDLLRREICVTNRA